MNKEALTPLVIKAQAKDADALNELMSACYETLYYYAYNEVKDYDLAGDITQESCLEIMNTLENLRKPESFLSWAGRIVTHKCSRYYRQAKKEVYLEENEDGETILDRLPDDSRGSLPEQVQEDKEFKRIMWDMLDSLPPEQRQALLLYYMEEFSVGQIAEMQDVPTGTVKSRLNYGRKAVVSKVDAYEKKEWHKAPLPCTAAVAAFFPVPSKQGSRHQNRHRLVGKSLYRHYCCRRSICRQHRHRRCGGYWPCNKNHCRCHRCSSCCNIFCNSLAKASSGKSAGSAGSLSLRRVRGRMGLRYL